MVITRLVRNFAQERAIQYAVPFQFQRECPWLLDAPPSRSMTRKQGKPMTAPIKPLAEPATTFARRHIGPDPRDVASMLKTVGASSLSALMAETLPSSIRQQAPLDLGARFKRNRGARPYARARLEKSGVHLADRPRLFRHDLAGGDPAQHPGEPGLVHGLYALSAGDQPGPAGSPVQLPDHDRRSHRA